MAKGVTSMLIEELLKKSHPFRRKAKLSPAQRAEIRRRYNLGDTSLRALAREYGVSHIAVYKIVHGRSGDTRRK